MTDAEKLEALVRRAVDDGWDIMDKYEATKIDVKEDVFAENYIVAFLTEADAKEILQRTFFYTDVLFNHDFARALFGEKIHTFLTVHVTNPDLLKEPVGGMKIGTSESGANGVVEIDPGVENVYLEFHGNSLPSQEFQYQLQQAVISDDPIGYYYKVVFGE